MDNGPFRMGNSAAQGRSAGRSAATNRNETERAHRAEPVEAPREPVRHHAAPAPLPPEPKKGWLKPALIAGVVVVVIVVLLCGWMWLKGGSAPTGIDTGKYQAAFFTNGQVYFGKLQPFSNEYMKLTDIYYLQTQTGEDTDSKNPQKTSDDQNNVQLIKLGDEIHGPTDEMIISKDQLLFYENLKDDGKVAESIKKYKSPK